MGYKEQVLEWMDKQIEACKLAGTRLELGELDEDKGEYEYEFHNLSGYSSFDYNGAIHCNDVRNIAKILEQKLERRERNDDDPGYEYEYFLIYKNYKFFSIGGPNYEEDGE